MSKICAYKKYCQHRPRCVKCTGDHATEHCTRKERSDDVQCILCEGNHPANYKGCTIYKELQKKTYPTLRQKQPTTPLTSNIGRTINPGISYSQAVTNQLPQASTSQNTLQAPNLTHPTPANDLSELKSMFKGFAEQLSTLLNLLTIVVNNLTK